MNRRGAGEPLSVGRDFTEWRPRRETRLTYSIGGLLACQTARGAALRQAFRECVQSKVAHYSSRSQDHSGSAPKHQHRERRTHKPVARNWCRCGTEQQYRRGRHERVHEEVIRGVVRKESTYTSRHHRSSEKVEPTADTTSRHSQGRHPSPAVVLRNKDTSGRTNDTYCARGDKQQNEQLPTDAHTQSSLFRHHPRARQHELVGPQLRRRVHRGQDSKYPESIRWLAQPKLVPGADTARLCAKRFGGHPPPTFMSGGWRPRGVLQPP